MSNSEVEIIDDNSGNNSGNSPNNDRPNLVLDLDQTVISAEPIENYSVKKHKNLLKEYKHYNMEGYYIIFVRPYADEFFEYIFKNFNVLIWTAATKDYALFIIDNVILHSNNNSGERKIDYIFFKYHVDVSEKFKDKTKSLQALSDVFKLDGYNLSNTFIIDDYDEVYNSQPENAIWIPPFDIKRESLSQGKKEKRNDKYLEKLIELLKKLKTDYDQTHSVQQSIVEINKQLRL